MYWGLEAKQEWVYELLQRLDRNGDDRLSRDGLRHGLRSMGVSLLPSELDSVMRAFDRNTDGTVDYVELYTVLSEHRAAQTTAADVGGVAASADQGGETMMQVVLQRFSQPAVREALDRLCWELASKQELVYELLQRPDRNGDGRLSGDELRPGLRSLGVSLLPSDPACAMRSFGRNTAGSVEFVVSYDFVCVLNV